jgi:SAM-dependent methyltransferase
LKNKFYDRTAAKYDRKWRKFSIQTHEAVLDAVPGGINGRVLDIGCGTGTFLEKLLQARPEIEAYGVDTSEAMLAEARKKLGGRASLQIQSTDRLPEFSRLFDMIISANVLHYIENPADWLVQIRGLLKTGGFLILEDFSKASRAVRYGSWLVRRIDEDFRRAYGLEEVTALAERAGLDVEKQFKFPIDWLWEGWLVRAKNPISQS